jgi:hypothetical protein
MLTTNCPCTLQANREPSARPRHTANARPVCRNPTQLYDVLTKKATYVRGDVNAATSYACRD